MWQTSGTCVDKALCIWWQIKESVNKMSEIVESFAQFQSTEELEISSVPARTSDASELVAPSDIQQDKHSKDLIIGDNNNPLKTRSAFRDLLSMIEPTYVDKTLSDDRWIMSMQEEMN